MPCRVCSSLKLGSPEWPHFHHKSYKALVAAAEEGCELCTMIHRYQSVQKKPVVMNEPVMYKPASDERASYMLFFQHCKDGLEIRLYAYAEAASKTTSILKPMLWMDHDSIPGDIAYQSRIWIDECQTHHSATCPAAINSPLPTRVIDIGESDGSAQPYLLITRNMCGDWVALSHCWGRNIRFVTDSTNMSERLKSIPVEDMPLTFHDAVLVTRRLGLRYLWIDSLCIIQGDAADWAAESQKMCQYYENSTVTIAAETAAGDEIGFYKVSQPPMDRSSWDPLRVPFSNRRTFAQSLRLHPKGLEHVWLCPHPSSMETMSFGTDPLQGRGWTFQEEVLAPRTIHYCSANIIWQCRHYQKHKKYQVPNRQFKLLSSINLFHQASPYPDEIVDWPADSIWCLCVMEFQRRSLTFESDCFPAISGLARTFHRQTGWTYLAGLWKEAIHNELLWRADPDAKARNAEGYFAPSWSWASLQPSAFDWPAHTAGSDALKLLSWNIRPIDGDIYGRLSSASIEVRGRWLPLSAWRRNEPCYTPELFRELLSHLEMDPPVTASSAALEGCCLLRIARFKATKMGGSGGDQTYALMLMPITSGSEGRHDHGGVSSDYRRIGLARIPDCVDCDRLPWDTKTISIY